MCASRRECGVSIVAEARRGRSARRTRPRAPTRWASHATTRATASALFQTMAPLFAGGECQTFFLLDEDLYVWKSWLIRFLMILYIWGFTYRANMVSMNVSNMVQLPQHINTLHINTLHINSHSTHTIASILSESTASFFYGRARNARLVCDFIGSILIIHIIYSIQSNQS